MKTVKTLMGWLDAVNQFLNSAMGFVAGLGLVGVMLIMVANMIMRVVYQPIVGTYDYVSWSGVIAVAFALGYTQLQREHVSVQILLNQLPRSISRFIKSLAMLVSVGFFACLTWWMFDHARSMAESGASSPTLGVAQYPFVYLVTLSFLGMTLALAVDFLRDGMIALGYEVPEEAEEDDTSWATAGPSEESE